MYEDLKEYLNWYDARRDTKFAADAPVIGLVLQRSHLVTGDEGHYSGVVSELEAQGAKVRPTLHSFNQASKQAVKQTFLSSMPASKAEGPGWVHTEAVHCLKIVLLAAP